MSFLDKHKSAVLSECGTWRYELTRGVAPFLVIIMLNPSKADATINDATINKLQTLATNNGYKGIKVYNAYAYRATDPVEVWALLCDGKHAVAVGPENKDYLRRAFRYSDRIVVGWGNHCTQAWAKKLVAVAQNYNCEVLCFGQNKNGSPKHPLYLKNETKLQPFVSKY